MSLSYWDRKRLLPHGAVTVIARRAGRSLGHVSNVISGRRRDRKVEVAVARLLKLPVDQVFPALDRTSREPEDLVVDGPVRIAS